MLLSHETTIALSENYANIVGHMCYAACKLWNVCNYERNHYEELGLAKYPDWYYQKAHHKDNIWFKSLPSQTAQEVCKLLDKSWKSYFALKKSGGIENPNPPRYKKDRLPITYMQNAIQHEKATGTVRLSVPKKLKEYMKLQYDISDNYLYLKNAVFSNTDRIKQIRIYPPDERGVARVIVIYEVAEISLKEDNGHYLSIDLGLHNLMTCYDNAGKTFILGRKYLSVTQYYDKEITRVQAQWAVTQAARGIRYPKPSRHLMKIYRKRQNCVKDYIHKLTKYVVDYCVKNEVHRVVIGDIRGIREENDLGKRINRQLHSLPYDRIYLQLEYKLKRQGIQLIKQEESYSSQCSPTTEAVSSEYAQKSNRRQRGLYCENREIYNADAVGAYNILRKYKDVTSIKSKMPESELSIQRRVKVTVLPKRVEVMV